MTHIRRTGDAARQMMAVCCVHPAVTDDWAMAVGGNNGAIRRRGGGRLARRKLREAGPAQASRAALSNP